MPAPKISVIMPTYNRARYLGEAIRSVLGQTWSDLELLVVDDGSTDGTRALVEAIGDERVRYLPQSHRGIGAAMNTGLRAARGEYVARLDSDDVWLPDMLEATCSVLELRPEVDIAYGKGQAMDARGRPLRQTLGMLERFPGDPFRSMLYDDFTCNVAMLVRRACFEQYGFFDESLVASEDWDMWLRLSRHCAFAFVDRVLVRFRWHDGNLTGRGSGLFAAVLESRTRPLDKLFAQPDLPPGITAMKPIAYRNVYTFRGIRWLENGELRRAGREFRHALGTGFPLTTSARIVWMCLTMWVFNRNALGQRFAVAIVDLRRRWRQ